MCLDAELIVHCVLAVDCGDNKKKRKACKNCSCGLAEELEAEKLGEQQPKQTQTIAPSACGSVSAAHIGPL